MDKIIGLGNALVDVLATLDSDEILTKMDLPKGSMTLIDEDKLLKINEEFSRMKTHLATGGSAGNAIRGMAQLGAGTGFIGKINNDSYGNFFRESLLKHGTEADLLVSDTLPSGVASIFYISGRRAHVRHIFGSSVYVESGRTVAGDVQGIYLSVYRGLSGTGTRYDSPGY